MSAFDTDILSDILRGMSTVMARAALIEAANQVVPIVAVQEVVRGRLASIRLAEAGKGRVDLPLAYDLFEQTFRALASFQTLPYSTAADKLFLGLRKAKIRVGANDLRIAAICIVHGATLVTRNARDYAQVPGLSLDVWN